MKKHRKLVALLVALTFLFSIAAPVMAAESNRAQVSADKLNVLGIIEGYPDGTFGLDRNITRAEFAKIAVVAAGLKDAAEQLVNYPSQFSDVKVGEWYTGWINMAASQGFVKGDPDGRFRPNDNITYAEVVTVLVRLLGYNDNLTGPWPTNYLAKAVELDITEGVALNASAPAVRGDVFIMTDNTLDCYTVYWNADNLDWTVKDDKLIVKSFKGVMNDAIVTDISWDSKGDIFLSLVDNDGKSLGNLKVVKNVIVTGAADAYGLLGKQVEFIKNQKDSGADRNAIVYLGVKDTDSVSKDKAEYTVRYIEIDSKRYDVASGFGVTFFPGDGDFDPDEDVELKGDKVEVVLNEDGEAQWAFVYNYSDIGADVIEEIDGDKVFGFNGARVEYDEDDVQVFVKDGALVDFDALAEGDLIYVAEDARNADLLVIAVSEVLEGELEKANADGTELTISGKKIKTDKGYANLISLDEGKNFDGELADVLGEAISYMLNPAGRVAVIISDVKATQKMIGVVETTKDTARGWETRILNPDGTKAVYLIDSDYTSDWAKAVGITDVDTLKHDAKLVEYSLDKNGRIDDVKEAKLYDFDSYDGNRAELDGKWYRVDSDAGFFGKDSGGKRVATDWDTFKNYSKEASKQKIQVVMSKGTVKAMFVDEEIVDANKIGVVADTGQDRNGYYYEIFFDGEKIRYNTTGSVDDDAEKGKFVKKGALVKFSLTSGKISSIDDTITQNVYSYKVQSATSSRMEVNDKYYYFDDEDTMIVDATGSTIKLATRVSKGDYVKFYEGEKGVVEVVVIVKAPEGDGGKGGSGGDKGTTYTFKGTYELDGNTYIQLGNDTYPFVGTAPDGLSDGDKVTATFTTIRGEKVVTSVKIVD